MPKVDVTRNDDASRYEARLGGELVGYADFRLSGETIVFPRTVTAPDYGGQGIASAVARYSLDDVRRRGDTKVVPQCWFYAEFIGRNPQYADLVAS
ncbi:MAG TPA: GNAT family N-acetyltransferase [Dermatophilaceae bacterium]|nr:GNAT family N-acetyltransferase [Dermatophilaceae bacterium]